MCLEVYLIKVTNMATKKRLVKVLTKYDVSGRGAYGSYCVGTSKAEIQKILLTRGLNEIIDSKVRYLHKAERFTERYKFDQLTKKDITDNRRSIMHNVCYMGYVLLKSGKYHVDQILGDNGVLHNLIHIWHEFETYGYAHSATWGRLQRQLVELEEAVKELGY